MALDLDTILFFDKDTPMGKIFDVFGPVDRPFYVVRLDSVHAEVADTLVGRCVVGGFGGG